MVPWYTLVIDGRVSEWETDNQAEADGWAQQWRDRGHAVQVREEWGD